MQISFVKLTYSKKKNALIFIIFALFLLIFYRGLKFDLAESVTERIRYHAIPTAMSVLYHGHPHDYTGLKAIALPFQGPGSLKDLIKNAKHQNIGQDNRTYYWAADDKGFEDFVIASFYLFSAKPISMYYMWFSILLLSTSLFLISFNKRLWKLSLLGYTYLGLLLAVSTLPLVSSHLKDGHIEGFVSIYETRFLDVLSFIPMLHIVLFAFNRAKIRIIRDALPLFLQIFIFIFLYHCRSSLGWQILSMIFILSLIIISRYYKNFRAEANYNVIVRKIITAIGAFILLMVSLVMLNFYKNHIYNSEYFGEMGARTFWHNALMGVGEVDPILSGKYTLKVDDYVVANSVINFAKNSHKCSADIENLLPQDLLNTLGGYGVANWKHYESCAKNFYFTIFNENKIQFLKLYIITKPWISINLMLTACRNSLLKGGVSDTSIGWHPFYLTPMIYFMIIFMLSFSAIKKAYVRILYIIAPIFVLSFIPSVAFYHAILTMGGVFVSASILIYVILGMIFHMIYKRFSFQRKSINTDFYHQDSKQLTIIIPAYNEQSRIALTISEVYECASTILQDFEIIVIDDGSTDKTYAQANDAIKNCDGKAIVISREINHGVGAAFQLGLTLAKFPQLCLIPGDNAFNIVGIKTLFSKCGTVPIVISYRQNMEVRTILRYFLSRVATMALRFITGFKIKDAHSLYIFPVAETRNLNVKSVGYGYHLETLSRLLNKFQSFSEVPVILNPKPDASSGVMRPKTILILGATISKLLGLRILGAL